MPRLTQADLAERNKAFQSHSPQELLKWAADTFPGRVAAISALQRAGAAVCHMIGQLELDIPILGPEIAAGSIYTRADWIRRGASDMSRIDVLRGGVTGVRKMAAICEGFGVKCEVHMSGFANLQLLGASSEDVCEYYERGLLAPGVDEETPLPYLEAVCDPLDEDGYVTVPTEPGMGYRLIMDYIEENRIQE